MSHFEAHDILTNSQHGFRKHHSCDTQLITTVNNLAKGLDKSEQIDAILLDFSKAFDKVAHSRLLKLENYGVRGNLLKWVQDFLSGRTQQVVLEGSFSQLYVQKNVYQNSFFPATIVLWNLLPQNVVEQPTLEGFQSALGRSAANN